MTERRDPLVDAIRAAGQVPPPPDRAAAFARAMRPVLMPSRRRLGRSFIALFAAAILGTPAAVLAAHATHARTAVVAPIVSERSDHGTAEDPETNGAREQAGEPDDQTASRATRTGVVEDARIGSAADVGEATDSRSDGGTETETTVSTVPGLASGSD
ncbi:MAG TPA: hypothetical protein VJ818_06595 [Actinomycetota bacterium]|nr:hypothetical protein [Actinomycetota bacterium]